MDNFPTARQARITSSRENDGGKKYLRIARDTIQKAIKLGGNRCDIYLKPIYNAEVEKDYLVSFLEEKGYKVKVMELVDNLDKYKITVTW